MQKRFQIPGAYSESRHEAAASVDTLTRVGAQAFHFGSKSVRYHWLKLGVMFKPRGANSQFPGHEKPLLAFNPGQNNDSSAGEIHKLRYGSRKNSPNSQIRVQAVNFAVC